MYSLHQIRELRRIIVNFGTESSKYLFHPKSKSSNLSLLAQRINSTTEPNEREWAKEICGTDAYDRAYIRLRSRLKRRLLDNLFHLHIRTGSEFRKALYRSAKDVFCIRILVLFGARSVAMWLISRPLERAQKYELTQDRIELLLLLRQDATLNGNKKKFARYANELLEAVTLRSAEMKMQSMNEEINVELVAKANISEKAKTLAIASYPEAATLFKKYRTFNIGLNYYRIASLAAESIGNSTQTFRLCCEAENFLAEFPHLNSLSYVGQFAVKRLSSAIAIEDFTGAHIAVQLCEQCFPSATNNWFIWKESEVYLLLHSRRWHAASALYREILGHDRFPFQPEQVRQMWAILGNYTTFALYVHDPSVSNFEIRSFDNVLNETPIYKRDKAGYNAALYILQYLILASRGEYDELVKKSAALIKYMDRYLRGRHNSQLYGFLKTLVILNKFDYNVKRTNQRATRYIEQFNHIGREKIDETQTLRFDLMWSWISDWSETRLRK